MSSVSFVAVGLQVENATQLALSTVRLRYTQDPLEVSGVGAHDALNPANYSLSGPGIAVVTSCMVVYGDTQSVDLFLLAPLAAGVWSVTAANVQTSDGHTLGAPFSATFSATMLGQTTPLNQGSVSETAYDVLRRHLNPAFQGVGWTALLEAFAIGDEINKTNAGLVFDQFFTTSASGVYLTRRVADLGIEKPADIGMPDATFRDYAVKLSTNKLTESALLEILEVFYGADTVRAVAETTTSEPFALSDGDDLRVLLDEHDVVQVVFSLADADIIGLARGAEVAAAITRALRTAGSRAYALPSTDPQTGVTTVRLYSGSRGLSSSVRVTGGKAQNALKFPTQLLLTSGLPAWTITVNAVAGTTRFTTSTGVDLSQLRVGDYVNVYGSVFNAADRGSFPVTAVSYSYPGGVLSQYFEVVLAGSAQVVTQLTATDVLYFRPTRETPYTSSARAVIVSVPGDECDIVIPATSAAVGRKLLSAAYLHQSALKSVTSCVRDATGTVTVVAPSHGMAVGDSFFLDGASITMTPPAKTSGNGTTTTDASPLSLWSGLAAQPVAGRRFHTATALQDGRVLQVGGETFVASVATIVNTSNLFRISATAPIGGGTQATYDYETGAAYTVTVEHHTATLLTDAAHSGRVLVAGGWDGATVRTGVQQYTPAPPTGAGSWGALASMASGHAGHSTIRSGVAGQVLVTGGMNTTTTTTGTCELWTPSTNTWGTVGALNSARAQHHVAQLTSGKVLAIGGRQLTAVAQLATFPAGAALATCELSSDAVGTAWSLVGSMTYARYGHRVNVLPSGRVLVTGGYGFSVTQPAADTKLNTCELFDPATNSWSFAGYLSSARANHVSELVTVGGRVYVYVFGGSTTSTVVDVLDTTTMQWSRSASTLPAARDFSKAALTGSGILFQAGGVDGVSGNTNTANSVLITGSERYAVGGLNGLAQVTSVVDANTFKYQTLALPYYTATTGGTVTPARAPVDATIPGPYAFDPNAGVAVTAAETTLTSAVFRGHSYAQLNVGDATVFPDAVGYVVLAWGRKNQVGPVKYLGRISSTAIALDLGYVFSADVGAGARVTWLSQRGPWVPDRPDQVGSFYLTASPAGRVAAQAAVAAASAAALEPDITITYPGDRGLGGEGRPVSGATKLSDIVAVFAGADVSAEVAAARSA